MQRLLSGVKFVREGGQGRRSRTGPREVAVPATTVRPPSGSSDGGP